MEQYKGFAYTKEGKKPTVLFGSTPVDILTKLNAYNVARTQSDKFQACNIGGLNAETSKYEDYHRYEVATGKDITAVYLEIPHMKKDEFQKVVADLKAAGARYNVNKKSWYITAEQNQQEGKKFWDICNQFSKTALSYPESASEHKQPDDSNKSEIPFMIENIEIQYAVRLDNQQTVIIPESDLNMWSVKGSVDEFFDKLNERAVERAMLQITKEQIPEDPEQLARESEYTISVSRDINDNCCTIWYNDGREPLELRGDAYGLHFPGMEAEAVADFVSGYLKNMEQPERDVQRAYGEYDIVDCYVPLRLPIVSPNQPIYVENISHVVGQVIEVSSMEETDAKAYTVLQKDGSLCEIRSDEIYAPDQARVLLRAAADELTGVQFDLLADKNLSAAQMEEIRFGFKDGLSVEQVALYANPEMTTAEMDLCRIALTNGLRYAEIIGLLKETKELSWTDSRNRLNEVIREHRAVKKEAQHVAEPLMEEQEASQREKEDIAEPAADALKEEKQTDMVSREREKLTEVQSHIVEHVNENFYKDSVSIEAVGNDRIRVTDLIDRPGEWMDLTMNRNGGIIDADTRRLYGYAKDGYRPPESQLEDNTIYGDGSISFADRILMVGTENGIRIIDQDVIDEVERSVTENGIDAGSLSLDLKNCIFRGVNFENAYYRAGLFQNADFSGSEFQHCKFRADMRGSRFQDTVFIYTSFNRAILSQCDFQRSQIVDCRFDNTDLIEVNFSDASIKQSGFYFECAIENSNFFRAQLDDVDVSRLCGVIDSKHFDTISAKNMTDAALWRLSGVSEVSYERKEELQKLFRQEKEDGLDPDNRDWRLDLSRDEEELIDMWEKQQTQAQETPQEPETVPQHTQSRGKRSVVSLLHEKNQLVSASSAQKAHSQDDRIRKAEALAK